LIAAVVLVDEGRGCGAAWQARPLHLPKPLRHSFIIIRRVVDDGGQQESFVGSHQVAAIDRELPLETEIALVAIVGVSRDHREE